RSTAAHRTRRAATALADRAMEQSAAAWRHDVVADVSRTGGLTEDRDVVGIASELRDVGLHPLQRCALIEQALVTERRTFRTERRMREETQAAEARRRRHDDS